MISTLRPPVRSRILLFLISVVLVSEGTAKSGIPQSTAPSAASAMHRTATDNLYQEIKEIANSHSISRAKKERRISTAVRVAVTAATAYKENPNEVLAAALELTQTAAAAAPSFAEVIASAVSFAPSLAHIDSAPGQIRTAAFAAAKSPTRSRRFATNSPSRPKKTPDRVKESIMPPANDGVYEANTIEAPSGSVARSIDGPGEYSMPSGSSAPQKFEGNRNSSFNVTADLSVRHDDNVYLTDTDKTGDTIIAVTPGVEFHFGQNSLAHGGINYKNAFTRYANKTAPNVALSSGAADFGYDSGNTTINANAAFQQLDQNNADVAALGQKAIFRQDVLGANASVESHLTAKSSVKTGVNYSKSDYKSGGLIGSQETEFPVKLYYETSPKVSISTGFAYRRVVPQNGGESGRDLDYNIGARGNFTAKLNGELSLDYRTRSVGDNAKENLLGLNGALNYEITPKTTSSLVFSRDFSTAATGASLKNSSYALRVSSDLSPQWQVGSGITYRNVEYGPTVFSSNNHASLVDRSDNYWEGDLQVSYLYRSWLTATADYTFRRNHSNLTAAQFSNSIVSLMLGWRY